MANEMRWTIEFRQDQCEFIVAALQYINKRCDERIGNSQYVAFDQFASSRTKERSEEIVGLIQDTIT